MPTVDSVFRTIASWKYIITSDLRDSFYQIPLEHSSMKWCATPTPYRGLRCYMVAAQGMPGSSETLEEVMCAVLGNLVKEGWVAKIADDLYVGGDSIDSLLDNWSQVLQALYDNGLKLKSEKTVIVPAYTQILGWDWHNGYISASKHKLSALSTCKPPKTVTSMRSFIGAYKVFNKVIRQCTNYIAELETMISGKQKQDVIMWSDHSLESFKSAQNALADTPAICLPNPNDELMLVHDGSNLGIG